MSKRLISIASAEYPYYRDILVEYDHFQGFALSQKRKNEIGLHLNFLQKYPHLKVLEVSSSSTEALGYHLSAMHLYRTDDDGDLICCESEFQGNRINLNKGLGPLTHLIKEDGKRAKKEYQMTFGRYHSCHYSCDRYTIPAPLYHISLFYDYNYIKYLLDHRNKKVADMLVEGGYDAFSDIATTSLNSQARACAIYVGLYRAGLLAKVGTIEGYMKIMRTDAYTGRPLDEAYSSSQIFNIDTNQYEPLEAVPKTVGKEDVVKYFNENFSHLSNSPKYIPEL